MGAQELWYRCRESVVQYCVVVPNGQNGCLLPASTQSLLKQSFINPMAGGIGPVRWFHDSAMMIISVAFPLPRRVLLDGRKLGEIIGRSNSS